jgi:asparagine synthase (glutamine-hydrolysing)
MFEALPEATKPLERAEELKEAVGASTLVPTYIAMRFAKGYVDSVYTGVGADELFLGYPVMKDSIEFLNSEHAGDIFPNLTNELFSGVLQGCDVEYPFRLGKALALDVESPFLSQKVTEFALGLPADYKVREGWGKWILRKAFEGKLPREIVWRRKVPIDVGSGAIKLVTEMRGS